MRVKCNCNNCSAHLEFESEDAGTVIVCPTCGIETKLFVAGSASSLPPANPQQMKNRRLKFGIIAAGSLRLRNWSGKGFTLVAVGQQRQSSG